MYFDLEQGSSDLPLRDLVGAIKNLGFVVMGLSSVDKSDLKGLLIVDFVTNSSNIMDKKYNLDGVKSRFKNGINLVNKILTPWL